MHLKLVSVMSIFHKEPEMPRNAHVNDYWSIVYDVMMQVLEISLVES